MEHSLSTAHYERRLNAVLDHIEQTYDQPLSLEHLANVAHFSPFHFHRLFKEYVGETPSVFVRRLRLQKALALVEQSPRCTLAEIALECGFAQSSDFTRAFREVYGYPPSKHTKGRAAKDSKIWQDMLSNRGYGFDRPQSAEEGDDFQVRVETLPTKRIAFVRVIGAYQPNRLIAALNRLLDWGRSNGIYPGAQLASSSPDNPELVPVTRYRMDLCMIVPEGFPESGNMNFTTLPERRYAMVHAYGDIHRVYRAWSFLFASWLPGSGNEPDDAPSVELFRNSDDSTGWSTLDLDCCLPIRPVTQ